MAYRPDEGEALALLESAIVTTGIAHAALAFDLYIGTPFPPAGLEGAAARLTAEFWFYFLIAIPFAFFVVWPIAALATMNVRRLTSDLGWFTFVAAGVPVGVFALLLVSLQMDLVLGRPEILLPNGALFGIVWAGLARVLIALHRFLAAPVRPYAVGSGSRSAGR
ncbi:hypothetical protein [Qipengyuania sp. JC766]|uniref:hypothetical protein n=1 Tax=Qipengyuania sp. JC766 TaxID=3232139 RepID=UPI0034584E1B